MRPSLIGKFRTVLLSDDEHSWGEDMVCPKDDFDALFPNKDSVAFSEDKKGPLFLHRNLFAKKPEDSSYRLSNHELHPVTFGENMEWVGEPQLVFSAKAWEKQTGIHVDPEKMVRLRLERSS